MKHILALLVLSCIGLPSLSTAATCQIQDTTIKSIHQYQDGWIFVSFDDSAGAPVSDCGCSTFSKTRMGFHKDSNESFIQAAALTAHVTGKLVSAIADDVCSIHGNTPVIKSFYLK